VTFNPAHYQRGDVIEVRQTFQVIDVFENELLTGADVKSGEQVTFRSDPDTIKVRMVKRVPRPKPKVGDVLRGSDIARRMWKRGTTIRCTLAGDLAPPLVLFADGKWRDVDGFTSYEFDDLNPDAGFELLLVA